METTTVRHEMGVTMYCHYNGSYTMVQASNGYSDAPSCFDDSAFNYGSVAHSRELRNHLRRHARMVKAGMAGVA